MLFEGFLRKRKIPPYYLELIMGIIFLNLIMIAMGAIMMPLSLNYLPGYVVLSIGGTVGALLGMLPISVLVFFLLRDKKRKRIVSHDVVITRYDDYPINIPVPGTPGWRTLLCFNYKEPFLQIIDFTSFPLNERFSPPMPIKFFIPAVYLTYCFQKDYKEIKEERKISKAEAEVYDDQNIDLLMVYEEDDNKSIIIKTYLTYAKMKELNQLFDLVNPPEFRITTYEESGVFISVKPIPGHDYPPEALECMEKINAMYP
jgi:hypothetical protein